jgi:hypothetical protein
MKRRVHYLKCVQPHYADVVSGRKRVEIRKSDRDFRVGDLLLLREYDPSGQFGRYYSTAEVAYEVTDILAAFEGLQPGWVAMSIVEFDGFEDLEKSRWCEVVEPQIEALKGEFDVLVESIACYAAEIASKDLPDEAKLMVFRGYLLSLHEGLVETIMGEE